VPKKGANVLKAHPGDGKAETLIWAIKPVDEPAFLPETAKFRSPSLRLFKRLFVVSRTSSGNIRQAMRREQSNHIRFVLEELLPPIVRDTALFKFAASLAWGKHITTLAEFRKSAPFLTAEQYSELYRAHPRIHEDTDNSRACLDRISADTLGPSICDVGCGTGALLRYVQQHSKQKLQRMAGVDIVAPADPIGAGIEFVSGWVENLPFPDNSFDTVICTHVIEHILDYRNAIAELRRIARRRLIVVVPREREGIYTFNPHFNFFPYSHSFLRAMIPVPASHVCEDIGRDIYYREDLTAAVAEAA
jgi:SAM-dependent methyltransferase